MPCLDFYVVTRSYSSRPFLCALASTINIYYLFFKLRPNGSTSVPVNTPSMWSA